MEENLLQHFTHTIGSHPRFPLSLACSLCPPLIARKTRKIRRAKKGIYF
jgi:hypothetical protein